MGFARVNFVMATLLAAMLANAASDVSDVMPPEYDALNVVTGASRMLAGAAPDNNNPPKFAAGTSPTALEKSLQVQSDHTISSDVIKNSNTQRSVNVADSKNVRITQPRLTVSMAGDANTHMSLTDTDALDVSDDESFDLVGTGNAKVIAGEMDDVASVFPEGTITRAQATGTEGTGASSIPPTIPPSTLSNDFRVTASFKVPSRIGSAVNVREETTVRGGESVHIDGINVDIKSGTSHNKQIVANDADLAGAHTCTCVCACNRPAFRQRHAVGNRHNHIYVCTRASTELAL
jgi:hypothetical protein